MPLVPDVEVGEAEPSVVEDTTTSVGDAEIPSVAKPEPGSPSTIEPVVSVKPENTGPVNAISARIRSYSQRSSLTRRSITPLHHRSRRAGAERTAWAAGHCPINDRS
jgi:hypothetical protein